VLVVAATRSPEEFAARAAGLLAAGPQTNLPATVLASALDGALAPQPPLFATVEERGEVVALALRTPPRPLIASEMGEQAAELLIEAWLLEDPGVCGVVAPAAAAAHLAAAWERRSGVPATLLFEEAALSLERPIAPRRPASGALRAATEADRALLARWLIDFGREAGDDRGDAESVVQRRLRTGGLFIWEHAAEPCCFVGVNIEVAGVVRIGPVFTPPERRRRGYATSAVAAATEAALARGARACMLFTDLANPTSNKIYAALGYEHFADWREYSFEPA
jgi:uncharacterized protein